MVTSRFKNTQHAHLHRSRDIYKILRFVYVFFNISKVGASALNSSSSTESTQVSGEYKESVNTNLISKFIIFNFTPGLAFLHSSVVIASSHRIVPHTLCLKGARDEDALEKKCKKFHRILNLPSSEAIKFRLSTFRTMLTLLSEIKFWTSREDELNVKDTDFGAFK